MSGGLMQLIAYGAQDLYLRGVSNINDTREDMKDYIPIKDEIPIKNRLIDKDKLMCSIGLRNINIGEKYQHCNNCKNNFCSESLFE